MGLFDFGKKKEQERLAELERQRELEKQREIEKQKQLERQKELERLREIERQKELEKQKELAKQRETERLIALAKEIRGLMSESKGAALINRNMTVAEDAELRKMLREIDVPFKVYDIRFVKKAFEGTDYAMLCDYCSGRLALAFFKDPSQLLLLLLFCKNMTKNCSVEAAMYQKRLISQTETEELIAKAAEVAAAGASASKYDYYFKKLLSTDPGDGTDAEGLSLYLESPGTDKKACMKVLHDLLDYHMDEIRDLFENAGTERAIIKKFDDRESLLEMKKKLEEAGAKVRIGS